MTTTAPHPPGATLHLGGNAYAHPDLQATTEPIDALTPYPGNPRRGDQDAITASIRDLGLYRTIIVQRSTGHVLAGNHTLRALTDLGATHVPVTWVDVDDTRAAAIVARDNRTSDLGVYDDTALVDLLTSLTDQDALLLSGYTEEDLALLTGDHDDPGEGIYTPPGITPSLADRFVVPPFTVLDQRAGAWQERKRRWLALGIQSEVGRGGGELFGEMVTGGYDRRVADCSEGSPLWTESREALAAAVKAKGWRHRDLDEYLGTNGMAGHYLGRAQPMTPTPAQWARLAEVLDLPEHLHDPMTKVEPIPEGVTQSEVRHKIAGAQRKGLGAVQTNLDGEDAARYGRKDTRKVDPRTYTNTEGLAKIKPGLKGALTGERTAGRSRAEVLGGGPTGESLRVAASQYREKEGTRRPGQERGRTLAQGLQATRDPVTGDLVYTETTAAGVSIFDPVLTELSYRWFSPQGGVVLDPFAGGSVRGIVAAALGRRYVGCELREEQVAANRDQADRIVPRLRATLTNPDAPVEVKVSAASARQEFHGCEPDYIRDVCKGRCCRSTSSPTGTGTMITIHPTEEAAIAAAGGTVVDGLLQPRDGEKRCPFQGQGGDQEGLCGLHGSDAKPFGCIASPFTLNANNTMIVRNRYRTLCCYKDTRADGTQVPAYIAFRASLDLIFGEEEAQRIHDHLDAGGGDLVATMPARSHRMLVDNDGIKHGHTPAAATAAPMPVWHVGDSAVTVPALDVEADLLFSCPPYADLEVYSDDPADISNMAYDDFLAAYRQIIAASVDRLRNDRFAVWVIGEVRDKRGLYRGFVPDTIRAFQDAGMALYNEAVLVTPVGSLPIRAGRQFATGRKLGKTHQTVLTFVKGDPRAAADACGVVDVTMPDTADPAAEE